MSNPILSLSTCSMGYLTASALNKINRSTRGAFLPHSSRRTQEHENG